MKKRDEEKKLREFVKEGRQNAKNDFNKLLKRASQPIKPSRSVSEKAKRRT